MLYFIIGVLVLVALYLWFFKQDPKNDRLVISEVKKDDIYE